jgi:hypothetical protein
VLLCLPGPTSLNATVLIIGGAVFAVVCAFVAQSKGRSMALWAVMGFFLGLIALIIIALLKKQEPTVARTTMSTPPPPPMDTPPPPAMPPAPPIDQTGQ